MTPEERAAKVYFDRAPDHHDGEPTHSYCPDCNVCKECAEKAIAVEIRAAVEEARKAPNYLPCNHLADGWCWPCVQQLEMEKKAEAYEDAARIVAGTPGNTYTTDCDHDELAESIRARAKEVAK